MKIGLKFVCVMVGIAMPISICPLGCKKQDQIQTYVAPKDDAPQTPADQRPDPVRPSSAENGFPADIRWTLPTGWKPVTPPQNPVFTPVAAFSVSADHPELILTISQLPDSPGARSVLENVKRWARQLSLPAPTEADLQKLVVHMQTGDVQLDVVTMGSDVAGERKLLGAILPHGHDTWVFKLAGESSAVVAQSVAYADFLRSVRFEQGGRPGALPPVPAIPDAAAPPSSVLNGADGAQWTLPEGWSAEAGNGFRVATIRPGNAPAEIKVSKLGGEAGGLAANVNRWRGEVGLEPVDEAHADAGQSIKLGEQAWTIHDYTGPANGGSREVIAKADVGGNIWYFKLFGSTDVVARVKPEFDKFLATVKFEK